MITRIVKMTFEEDKVDDFMKIFDEVQHKIKNCDGCRDVYLLQSIHSRNICFTYSLWDNETSLQAYRDSELFESTWKRTKALFLLKAEAWSLKQLKD